MNRNCTTSKIFEMLRSLILVRKCFVRNWILELFFKFMKNHAIGRKNGKPGEIDEKSEKSQLSEIASWRDRTEGIEENVKLPFLTQFLHRIDIRFFYFWLRDDHKPPTEVERVTGRKILISCCGKSSFQIRNTFRV